MCVHPILYKAKMSTSSNGSKVIIRSEANNLSMRLTPRGNAIVESGGGGGKGEEMEKYFMTLDEFFGMMKRKPDSNDKYRNQHQHFSKTTQHSDLHLQNSPTTTNDHKNSFLFHPDQIKNSLNGYHKSNTRSNESNTRSNEYPMQINMNDYSSREISSPNHSNLTYYQRNNEKSYSSSKYIESQIPSLERLPAYSRTYSFKDRHNNTMRVSPQHSITSDRDSANHSASHSPDTENLLTLASAIHKKTENSDREELNNRGYYVNRENDISSDDESTCKSPRDKNMSDLENKVFESKKSMGIPVPTLIKCTDLNEDTSAPPKLIRATERDMACSNVDERLQRDSGEDLMIDVENMHAHSDVSSTSEEFNQRHMFDSSSSEVTAGSVRACEDISMETELNVQTKKKRGGGKLGRKRKRGYIYDPKPLVRKNKPTRVPNETKDPEYWDKRKRNNEAAKRSRENRRAKELEIIDRAKTLDSQNQLLRTRIKELEDRNSYLESILAKQER